MNKTILVGLAILTASTSAASAWTHQSYRTSHRTHYSSAYRTNRAVQREAMNSSAYNRGYYRPGYAGYYGPGYAGYYGPGYAAGAALGTAGAIAAGAVNTAGAIATAPFRPAYPYGRYPANSYAYYPASSYAGYNSYAMAPVGVSSKNHEMYMKNLRASGYNPKNDFDKAGNMAQH